MRIFKNLTEARGEILRDFKEMGIDVANTHMQDKVGEFPTLELINYGYTILEPRAEHLNPSLEWATQEWLDRYEGITGHPVNPGKAWHKRSDIWHGFIETDHSLHYGKFSYTYSERFAGACQVLRIVEEIRSNPNSRQLYLSLWDPNLDIVRIGVRRVPCSLGWHFMVREKKLHVTYSMRSCDFVTHWDNDVWLTLQLLDYISSKTGIDTGRFSQFINSFHIYEKDVADIF